MPATASTPIACSASILSLLANASGNNQLSRFVNLPDALPLSARGKPLHGPFLIDVRVEKKRSTVRLESADVWLSPA